MTLMLDGDPSFAPATADVDRGQAAFTRTGLALYDLLVLRRVALLDLNTHCLARTARRIARYHPEIYRADVLQPIVLDVRRFDSIALNYVVHCLPASWPDKGVVFEHLKALLNPGGTLFGATLVQDDGSQSAASAGLMRWFNVWGTLHNQADTRNRLVEGLEQHLNDVRVEQVGCVALFSGRA